MKKHLCISYIVVLSLLYCACNNENAPECFKAPGDLAEIEVQVEDDFQQIQTDDEVDVVLRSGSIPKVSFRGGANVIPELEVKVEQGILRIFNRNRCNWVRSSGNPQVLITNDQLHFLEVKDFVNVSTDGVFKVDSLVIISEGTGNLNLEVEARYLSVESKFVSNIWLKGKADSLILSTTYDSRITANELLANKIRINHQGSNDYRVSPILSLTGIMRSTGNLIYFRNPEVLEVEVKGKGKLIRNF